MMTIVKGFACQGQCDMVTPVTGGTLNCTHRLGHEGPHSFEKIEAVNHPAHYGGDVPHEVIKCLNAWGLESDALLWNAVKYIAHAGKKGNQVEDLKKARFYLDRRILLLDGRTTPHEEKELTEANAGAVGVGSPGESAGQDSKEVKS